MRKKIIISLVITIILAGSFMVANSVSAQGGDLSETIPKLRIKFPQILESFSAPVFVKECPDGTKNCAPEQQRGYVYIPWLAQYVSAIYKYALGIASIMAVVAVMVGGIMYLTSAGSAGRIDEAKKIIFGAISGLVIIIFSYVLLNLVNPELVKLTPIRVEAVVEEVLATGNFCKDLDANKIVVDVGGTPQPTNFTGLECGKEYSVSAKSGAAVSVPQGQTCFGDFCQKGGCAASSGGGYECKEALFYGEITGWMRNFNSYIDEGFINIRGIPGNVVFSKIPVGPNDKTYTMPFDPGMEMLLKKYDKVFFQFESNNTACYGTMAYSIVIGKLGIDDIINSVKCFFTPTIDQDFYAIKHYDPANKNAIWGFPYTLEQGTTSSTFGKDQCSNCYIMEKNSEWIFVPKPWCNFWEVEDLINAAKNGSGTEVNFNLDDFPDLPSLAGAYSKNTWATLQSLGVPNSVVEKLDKAIDDANYDKKNIDWRKFTEVNPGFSFFYPYIVKTPEICNYYSENTPVSDLIDVPMPGSPCGSDFFFDEKPIQSTDDFKVPAQYEGQTATCRPTSVSIGQWVIKPTSQSGQPCDNLAQVTFFVPGNELSETAFQNKQKGSQLCDTSKSLSCKYISNSTAKCENPTAADYCYGTCGTAGEDFIKPGDACSGQCPTYKGQVMHCVQGNCYLGTWGDKCDTSGHCASGFTCKTHVLGVGISLKFCAQSGNLQAFQSCLDTSDCQSGLTCRKLYYADEDEGISGRCSQWAALDDVDPLKVCIQDNLMDDLFGVCDCDSNNACGNVTYWPPISGITLPNITADFCTNTSDEYCSPVIEGGWCNPDDINPLPPAYQSDFYCMNVDAAGSWGIIQRIQN